VDDLIKEIQERTGLSADKVLEVVTVMTDYMKNVLPSDLVTQVTTALSDAASSPGDAASQGVATAAGYATMAVETTAAVITSAIDAVTDLIPSTDAE
jgi:hypothetical protein